MSRKFKTRKKYRLTFVNENTFNTVWSFKLSRIKVWLLSAVACAAVAALAVTVFVWSPLKTFLPGYIKDSERRQLVDNNMRVDSMLAETYVQRQYVDNIVKVLTADDPITYQLPGDSALAVADTLMVASDRERAFVDNWMERERGNLSVLTPIAAEGMMFRLPAQGARILTDGSGLRAIRGATVVAIQDATVISSSVDPLTGTFSLVLQHANDFITTMGGLKASFVTPGKHVVAGQALGALGEDGMLPLSVWHRGARIDLHTLLPQ